MSGKKIFAEFDEHGVVDLHDQELLELVVGGGVSILQTSNTPTDSNCLNGVCFDGNTACPSANVACGGTPSSGQKINPACFPNPDPGNYPCATNRTCHIP